jgi:phage tail sheath gpL-like
MPDPLLTLAPYLAPSREPDYLAALRIAEAACAGRRASLAAFGEDPARVVQTLANHVRMPTDSTRVDVYEALGTLRELLELC